MTQKAFSEKLNTAQRNISKYETGLTSIPDEIEELLARDGLNLHWLATGEGPMFIHSQDPAPDEKSETVLHLNEESKCSTVLHLEDEAKRDTVSRFHAIPDRGGDLAEEFQPAAVLKSGTRLMGRRKIEVAMEEADPRVGFVAYVAQPVSAGPGRDLEALYETARLPVMLDFIYPWRPDQVIALQVRGDSMTGVGIFDFDIVLYVPTRREKDEGDGIYVISVDNKMLVKRLEFDLFNGHIRIISENERYSPKELRGEDSDRMTIEGKVIGWLHRHPY